MHFQAPEVWGLLQPALPQAQSKGQNLVQLRSFLFVCLFVLRDPGNMGGGIGAADRNGLNIDGFAQPHPAV